MENKDKKVKIIFSEEQSPLDIVSKILEQNGLKEDLDEGLDKIENGGISLVETLYRLSINFVLQKISEKDFVLEIQKQLGASTGVSQNISKNIKEMLLPLAEKINIETEDTQKTVEVANKSTNSNEDQTSSQEVLKINKTTRIKTIPKLPEIKKLNKTGPDNYREPIE